MGKPYQSELDELSETYRWAMSEELEPLAEAIKASAHLPLIAVGSGGSFSVAEVMVSCHERYFSGLARAVTPLEILSALPSHGQVSVSFFSAGGGNIDILRSVEHTLLSEPKHVTAVVGRRGSPLSDLFAKHQYANLFEIDLPTGKDGFLATNSLLAFSILICRAYNKASQCKDNFPESLKALLKLTLPPKMSLNQIRDSGQPLWARTVLHVLYSNELKAAAMDIESKFIEAGLSSVHLADFRNFAHGRHHWLAKHGDTSAILALSVCHDAELAEKTLKLIPGKIPRIHIPLQTSGASAMLTGLILSLNIAGYAGNVKGIDPGKPGVPSFGSKIYNLKTASPFLRSVKLVDASIRRKTGTIPELLPQRRRELWENAYNFFIKRLSKARFGGLVMDYDGTIVEGRHRFDPPSKKMVMQMVRLLENGIIIGFATGRGKSIRKDLRNVIPINYWEQIVVGYYNGAETSLLTDDNAPDGTKSPCADLLKILQVLKKNIEIMSLAKVEPRKFQITVEPVNLVPENFLWELAQNEMYSINNEMTPKIYRSSHSIDILAQGVTKISVVSEVLRKIAAGADVLTIGDRGKWPGNDCALLNHIYSLSVDEVSFSKDTCWNLCPAGIRGPQGTLHYLRSLMPVQNLSYSAVRFCRLERNCEP